MPVFHLFRLKVERPQQAPLFGNPEQSNVEIIKSSIEEKPSQELNKGNIWRIGNIVEIGDDGLFFALGRITKSIVERYDESKGDFLDEALDEAPYTYVFVDLQFQVCAIAQKPKIAQKPGTIASYLAKLLTQSNNLDNTNLKITLSLINDPDDFIELLKTAFRISHFEMTFSPPNPFDVEHDFHQPMERLLGETNGNKGKTSIDGEHLEPRPLEELARSAAGTGESAKAKIQSEEGQKPILKHLKGNPVTLDQDDLTTDDEKRTFLERVRDTYRRIRGTVAD